MEDNKIPKIIHYCWFGNNAKSDLVNKCIDSWKKFLPDYEIIEWNEDKYDISQNIYLQKAYEKRKWAFVSDYVRLDVLQKYGGIYLDTDVEIIRPFDSFLSTSFFTCFEENIESGNYLVSTAVLGCKKDNPIINSFLEIYNSLDISAIENFSIPNTKLLTSLLVEKFNIKLANTITNFGGNYYIYPSDHFCPKNWATKKLEITANTYAIHHFDGSWKTRKDKIIVFISGKIKQLFGDSIYIKIKKIYKRIFIVG